MPKAPHPVELRDQAILGEAVLWTAFVQIAPGDRRKVETATRDEAETHARAAASFFNRPVMVYGVNAAGRTALATVIRPNPGASQMQSETSETTAAATSEAPVVEAPAKAPKAPKAAKAAKAPKAPKAAAAPKAPKALSQRAQIEADVAKGKLPPAPDFSAETHKRFRAKLAELVAAAKAGDVAALKAFTINPISSSPKALDKYRNLAVQALEARAAKKA